MNIFPFPPRKIAKTGDPTPARSIWHYVWRMSGLHQVWICLLALLVAALGMVPLEIQRRLVDQAIEDGNLSLLIRLGVAYLAVLALQGGLKYSLRLYQGWLNESAVRYSRAHLVDIHGQRTETQRQEEDGRAVSVIGPEIDKLGGFVGEGPSQAFVNLGMLVAILGYMLTVEPRIALISLLFFIPQVVLVPLAQRPINRFTERRVDLMRKLSDSVAELSGESAKAGISTRLRDIYANRMCIFMLKFAVKAAVNFLSGLAILSVLLVGGYLVIEGQTSIGVVVAFISGFERLSNPLRELLAYYKAAAHARVQHDMIARWM